MKFLAGECPNRGLLLHPLYDPDAVLDVWARYVWLGTDPGTVWRIVETTDVNRAAQIVRETPSDLSDRIPDKAKEWGVKTYDHDHDDRTDRDDSNGKRKRPGRVTRSRTEPVSTGDPW